MSNSSPKVVGYITDVEGNWEYFQRCLALCSVLEWSDSAQNELVLKDCCYFVFGGDAGDKRDGTIRFVKLMVKLKQRYPDRVFLLVGNRDQNKLRFLSELTVQDLHACIPPLPAGVTGAGKDCRQYLKELAVAQGAAKTAEEVTDDVITLLNTMPNRLRWILDCTMGSVGDFEYRRKEMAMLSEGRLSVGDIDDDAVVASFYESVAHEDGFMRQYMLLGQLAVTLDNTLYVHGGVYGVFEKSRGVESCVGLVPNGNDLASQLVVEDRDGWVEQLNRWMRSQVDSIIAHPAYDADRVSRAGQALFLYGSYSPTPSVIMARMLDDSSMPLPMPEVAAALLKRWGLCRVVCGHTPHGNAPTVFTSHGVQVVMADTSYSDMSSKGRPTDNRGVAASEVLICGPVLQVHGLLQDSVAMDFVTVTGREGFEPSAQIFNRTLKCFAPLDSFHGDENIGKPTQDGFFVKSATADRRYSLCKVTGRDYLYKYVDAAEMPSLL